MKRATEPLQVHFSEIGLRGSVRDAAVDCDMNVLQNLIRPAVGGSDSVIEFSPTRCMVCNKTLTASKNNYTP